MILTVAEVRKHVTYPEGTDADDALRTLLELAEATIERVAGPLGPVSELLDGGLPTLITTRPVDSVSAITQDIDGTPLLLAADDYRHSPSGYVITRLGAGTNPGTYWTGVVQVDYIPSSDVEARVEAQIALVRLAIDQHPGLTSLRVGDWAATFTSAEMAEARAAALEPLHGHGLMRVV